MEGWRMSFNPLNWFKFGKVALVEKSVIETAVTAAKQKSATNPMKPSWQTGEFWTGPALVQLALAWEGVHGLIDGKTWAIGSVVIGGLAFIVRTWLKKHDVVQKAIADRSFPEIAEAFADLKDDLPQILNVIKLLKGGDPEGAARAANDLKDAA
jgi:hypothetical protein